ncbi:MAG: GNAT family N-acetyltransferase [Desulfobacterales bacterium CG23_combo_of_CG06-09_8_20_14_all_51_8]|nr:MAG: GNAT family N-acetyltransferase [Desulfobacterales bacterium CG23_combo_of_CG06-09_8_20_14_all_51_8]
MIMPSYNFITHPTEPQIRDIIRLYQGEGWWEGGADNPETVRKIIAGSHCFVVVTENDAVIGMGRAISDRASDAYIQDVTVLPEFRGKGIGVRIIRMIMERLNADGIGWIGLIAEKNARAFYEPLGFSVMPNAAPMLKKR